MRYAVVLALPLLGACYFPTYEEERRTTYRTAAPRPSARINYQDQLGRSEIEKMIKAGVSDAIILEKAKRSGVIKLSVDDIVALKQAGASDDLIKELIANERQASVAPATEYVPATTTTYTYSTVYGWPAVTWGWPYTYSSCWPRTYYYGGYRCGPRVGVRIGW
jgi:hypothetical protein